MSCDYFALANPGVQGLHPYQAGKPTEELERELGLTSVVKLASNENPLGLSDQVKAGLQAQLAELTRYPDSNGFYLKAKLAEMHGVQPEQITLGNGSNDLLELIARVFVSSEHEVIFSQYAFIVYPLVAQSIGATAISVPARDWGHDLDAMAEAITDKTRMLFIANPNNPTGTFLEADELLSFLDKVPGSVIVVLDEAYYEYFDAALRPESTDWLTRYPNLVVTRTFSKAYGLAGLRVGYSVSSALIADLLNRVRQPFNVNAMAMKAAEIVLDDKAYLAQGLAVNNAGMAQLESFFNSRNIEFIPSKGNFICFVAPQGDAMGTNQRLLEQGVIVRPLAPYQMPEHLRVSIGTQVENQTFIDAMIRILEN